MTMAPGFGMEPTQPTTHDAGGPPGVGTALVGEPELGSRGLRLVAYIADELLITFIIFALWVVIGFFAAFVGDTLRSLAVFIAGIAGLLIHLGYFPYWWSRDGQTLAMMPLGLRVVDESSGETISLGRAFVRLVMLWVSIAVFFLGVLWTLVDDRRRGWHDLVAKTIVIGDR